MNTNIKTKWINDLRSGDYKQGKYKLYNSTSDSYCCLGVLAKQVGHTLNATGLETSKLIELGISYQEQNKLMGMNDSQNKSFDKIADYIEKNM